GTEQDALKRAQACNRLAERFAEEMRWATVKKESLRVAALGNHLQELLTRGVAGNLAVARTQVPPDSPRSGELERVGVSVAKVTGAVEAEFERVPADDNRAMEQAVSGARERIQRGRTEVENAVKGKGKGKGFHSSKGKKNKK